MNNSVSNELLKKAGKVSAALESTLRMNNNMAGKKIDIESTGLIDKIIVTDKYERKEYVFCS